MHKCEYNFSELMHFLRLTYMFIFKTPDNQGKPGNTMNVRHLAYTLGRQWFSREILLNKSEMNVF